MQFLTIAVAVGTGVGVNTYMARKYALGHTREADAAAGTVMVLAALSWAVFAVLSTLSCGRLCAFRPARRRQSPTA